MDCDSKLLAWKQVLSQRQANDKLLRQKVLEEQRLIEQETKDHHHHHPPPIKQRASLPPTPQHQHPPSGTPPTHNNLATDVAKLQRQMKDVRKYVKIWIKREQIKRSKAASVLQRIWRGHCVRKHYYSFEPNTITTSSLSSHDLIIKSLLHRTDALEKQNAYYKTQIASLNEKLVESIENQKELQSLLIHHHSVPMSSSSSQKNSDLSTS